MEHAAPEAFDDYVGFRDHPRDTPFTYLSLGVGVQSSALLLMSALGLRGCPKADVAIFADTQDEPAWVYEHLQFLTAFGANHGMPVLTTSIGGLSQHFREKKAGTRARAAAIPFWSKSKSGRAAPMRRQCTREYKIDPITQVVRKILGYKPRHHMKHSIVKMLGISTDEATRMKPARNKWEEHVWPLIDAGMSRQDCLDLHAELGVPVPKKSSCVWCPFHSLEFWKEIHDNHPEEWARCVEFDRDIRDMSGAGIAEPMFLSKLLIPLEEHQFTTSELAKVGDGFDNECEGHCGI
jgi:hypothetical protein